MKLSSISLPAWVLIGAVLGIVVGIFFGDYTAVLEPVGTLYVKLLESVVFPYIICSLVHGLGSLEPATASRLFKRSWMFFVLAWAITFGAIFIVAQAIPSVAAPAIIDPAQSQDLAGRLMTILVPANFFADLTRNYVPAVVAFSILFGVAIQYVREKQGFLAILELVRLASLKIWNWVVQLAPFAVFALFAVTAGTTAIENLPGLVTYLVLFLATTFLLAFWVLPAVVGALTALPAREVIREIRGGIVLAAVTTLSAAAVPAVLEACRKLAAGAGIEDKDRDEIVKTTLSISYPLGQLGNFFVYLFFLSAASLYQIPLTGIEPLLLPLLVLVSCLGSPTATVDAVSFLADWLQFPVTTTQLYVETMTITRYGQIIVSVVGFAFLTTLGTFSYYGKLRFDHRRFWSALGLPAIVFGAMAVLTFEVDRQFLGPKPDPYLSFSLAESTTAGIDVSTAQAPSGAGNESSPSETLERIRSTGVLRVGYNGSVIPFSYFNRDDRLVGYDIAFAYELARSLNARLELIPFEWVTLHEDLAAARFDIAMAGIYVTEERLRQFEVSRPYFQSPIGFIVKSEEAGRFISRARIEAIRNLQLTVFNDPVLLPLLRHTFPEARIRIVENYRQLSPDSDEAAIWSFQQAAAFVAAHRGFTAVAPEDLGSPFVFAYLMPKNSEQFLRYVNYWLDLKASDGFQKRMHDYWILGKSRPQHIRRWSVARNVLHWVP